MWRVPLSNPMAEHGILAPGLFQEEEGACTGDAALNLKRTSLAELGLLCIWLWALHLG